MNLNTPCIEYQGCLTHGYGHMTVNGKNVKAHRHAWEQANGPIPAGQVVRHRCDNRACINVEHLELGTQLDNMHDMWERGGQVRGEGHHMSKLSDEDVQYIRAHYVKRSKVYEQTQKGLAERFGVTQSLVSLIVNKKHWHADVLNEKEAA